MTIILGSCTGVRDEDSVIYGSPEIFTDEVPFRAELAAKADAKTGTFRIGLRLVEPTMNRYVRVNWTAIRDAKEKVHDVEETALLIRPDTGDLEHQRRKWWNHRAKRKIYGSKCAGNL